MIVRSFCERLWTVCFFLRSRKQQCSSSSERRERTPYEYTDKNICSRCGERSERTENATVCLFASVFMLRCKCICVFVADRCLESFIHFCICMRVISLFSFTLWLWFHSHSLSPMCMRCVCVICEFFVSLCTTLQLMNRYAMCTDLCLCLTN